MGASTSPPAVCSQTRSTCSDRLSARSATDFLRVQSSSSSPISKRNITVPAVPKSRRQTDSPMDRASSSSTRTLRRQTQPSPCRRKGIICQTTRAARSGGGKNRLPAALASTLPTSFSSNARFSARVLCSGGSAASAQQKPPTAASTASRPPR